MAQKKRPRGKTGDVGSTPPTRRHCRTMDVHYRLLRTAPGYAEARAASEDHALRAAMTRMIGRVGCTRIPVVVHVVYKTAAQNISDAQVKSQIDVLNEDFRRKNADIVAVPAPFAGLSADTRIEFQLATTDPAGNPTTGIVRRSTTVTSFSDDDAVKSNATGGSDAWPSDKYLNLWVCQLAGGLLGYAQFPGGPAATDGVVIRNTACGRTGTAAAPFNLGRTATHEVGHWLNLRHIWGDDGTGCSGDDFVADTPNQGGPNYGTPSFPKTSCGNAPNGDLFVNFMDYVDDAAMVMFTGGQVTRMQAVLDGLRSAIGSSIPCGGAIKKLEPDIKKNEPDIKKNEPDIKKIEPDIKKIEPDIKKIEPDIKKNEPDIKKREPDIKKIEPDIKKREPDIKKNEPDIKKIEPDVKKNEPDIKKREPDIKKIEPDIKKFEPDIKKREPDIKKGEPEFPGPGPDPLVLPSAHAEQEYQYEQGPDPYAQALEERLQRIEAALAQLSHFIQQGQRPDVARAPLRKEKRKE